VEVASAGLYASLHLIPDNHANIPPLSFLQAGCPFCHPTNSIKALKDVFTITNKEQTHIPQTFSVRTELSDTSESMLTSIAWTSDQTSEELRFQSSAGLTCAH